MQEQWLDLEFLDNRYAISNQGRIKNNRTKTILKPVKDNRGYHMFWVKFNGIKKGYQYHRLVLSTFNPVLNWESLQVNHIDCNPQNNRLDNLEWTTVKENNMRKRLSKFPKSRKILKKLFLKYTDDELSEILNLL